MKCDAVILANGDFPRKGGDAFEVLNTAKRVVACDGAALTYYRRMKRRVDYVVGDLDSLPMTRVALSKHAPIRVAEQETNDLEKAIAFCRAQGWKRLILVGASGKREDHLLGNVFRAMEAGIEMWTDAGRFIPFVFKRKGRYTLQVNVAKNTPISIFSSNLDVKMRSTGLVWPLTGVRFDTFYRATLNRAALPRVKLEATSFAFAFVAD